MRLIFGIMAIAITCAGCAKKPENIAAADVGANEYRGYSCKQIAAKRTQTAQGLEQLSAEQRSAASNDAVGVLLLGLPLASMSGSDKETAIAVAKGHLNSMDAEFQRKGCR